MKKSIYEIAHNIPIAQNIYEMKLYGDISEMKTPGQFVEIAVPGLYLRRPISVCYFDPSEQEFIIIYKTVGAGTDALSRMGAGERLDIITGLGNGYNLSAAGKSPLLIGGGVGIPPLYGCAAALSALGISPRVLLGFNCDRDAYSTDKFAALGLSVAVATADGSIGTRGFVTDIMPEAGDEYSYFYSCGPLPMLKAVAAAAASSGEFSLEARMGCGFGACMGCTVMTNAGARRVCRDGPVFRAEDIIW